MCSKLFCCIRNSKIAPEMSGNDDVPKQFAEHGLVPDVVSTAPQHLITLEFGSKAVHFGNELSIAETAKMPTKVSWPTEPNTLYTLIFSDADVPSRATPMGRSFLHMLVTNIPGTDIEHGNTLREYVGPGAPKDSGLHRYNFLVYKQNGRITDNDPSDGYDGPDKKKMFEMVDERFGNDPERATRIKAGCCWSPERYAKKHGLGAPIAGNFWQTQWSETA